MIKLLLPLLEQLLFVLHKHCAKNGRDTEKLTVICQNTLKDLWEPVEADEILLAEKTVKKLKRSCSRLIIRLFLEAAVKVLFYCVKGKIFGVVILRIPYKMRCCWRQLRLQVFVAPGICCSGCGI